MWGDGESDESFTQYTTLNRHYAASVRVSRDDNWYFCRIYSTRIVIVRRDVGGLLNGIRYVYVIYSTIDSIFYPSFVYNFLLCVYTLRHHVLYRAMYFISIEKRATVHSISVLSYLGKWHLGLSPMADATHIHTYLFSGDRNTY